MAIQKQKKYQTTKQRNQAVSYTHLDVYKRQVETIIRKAQEKQPEEATQTESFINLASVSYTHLDVYKRQEELKRHNKEMKEDFSKNLEKLKEDLSKKTEEIINDNKLWREGLRNERTEEIKNDSRPETKEIPNDKTEEPGVVLPCLLYTSRCV